MLDVPSMEGLGLCSETLDIGGRTGALLPRLCWLVDDVCEPEDKCRECDQVFRMQLEVYRDCEVHVHSLKSRCSVPEGAWLALSEVSTETGD